MKASLTLLAAIVSFGASVAAQSSSDPLCLTTCTPLSKVTTDCSYDLTSDTQPTDQQVTCMCKEKGFASDYSSCYGCLEAAGLVSSSEFENSHYIQSACNSITGTTGGAGALTPGSAGVLGALFVTVGLGFCGITI